MERETAMKILKESHNKSLFAERTALETIIPELKESEDERVKKRILLSLEKDLMATKNSGCDTQDLEQCIVWLEKQGESYTKKDVDDAYLKGISDAKNELEKQGEQKSFDYESANIQQKDFAQKPTDWWSEEDEEFLRRAINATKDVYPVTANFLKSLKDRATWKPSEKQMEALDDALNERGFDYNNLNSLYEQLKKL